MRRFVPPVFRVFLFAIQSLMAVAVHAQESGSIAGSARDTTGAMLPGVTVEAASPALIEKVRVGLLSRGSTVGVLAGALVLRLPALGRHLHGDHGGRSRRR